MKNIHPGQMRRSARFRIHHNRIRPQEVAACRVSQDGPYAAGGSLYAQYFGTRYRVVRERARLRRQWLGGSNQWPARLTNSKDAACAARCVLSRLVNRREYIGVIAKV